MQVEKITVGKNFIFHQINCYLIIHQKEVIIIDPADQWEDIKKIIESEKIKPISVILTHAHVDHIKDVKAISEYFSIPVFIHESEKEHLNLNIESISNIFGISVEKFKITRFLNDNEIIKIGDEQLQIIHTPGHSPGGICIKGSDFLISGDTLFANGLGRTDLPLGNEEQIITSIKNKLLILDEELIVYPGHGDTTTIKQEKINWNIV